MKILILVLYYNRPKLLEKAMKSVLVANEYHSNWEMIFGDDNSPISGEPIVRKILKDHQDKITFVNSNATIQDKIENGLKLCGLANELIPQNNSDIVITLCDDDMLMPTYLRDISNYFTINEKEVYAYSHLYVYNPFIENQIIYSKTCSYNKYNTPINPARKLDSSQVAFRLNIFKDNVKYPTTMKKDESPFLVNPDEFLFQRIFEVYGEAKFTGLISQYKGIHDHQLIWHKQRDFKEYIENINELASKGTI